MPRQRQDDEALQKARQLVASLEMGDEESASRLIENLGGGRDDNLFREIGKLTRQLHEALTNFQLDSRIPDLAAQHIPDAKERLEHVITMTEQAANRTMDAIENSIPLADTVNSGATALLADWQKLMRRELKPGEFREMTARMETFLQETQSNSAHLQALMTEILMAQDYQDLTGQIIRRVIRLVRDVEESLVGTIRMFGAMNEYQAAMSREVVHDPSEPEGPVVNPSKRTDVVSGQDDVDDLLSSLGF